VAFCLSRSFATWRKPISRRTSISPDGPRRFRKACWRVLSPERRFGRPATSEPSCAEA
jgi:hypothetical protein